MSPPHTASAKTNFVASIILIPIASLATITRFAIKICRHQRPDGPDWLCFLATILFDVHSGLILEFIFNVSLYGAFDLDFNYSPLELANLAKYSYKTEIIYTSAITSVKLSILWFYYQIFLVDRRLRHAIFFTALLCLLWFIAFTLVIVFQCTPPQAFWEKLDDPKYCLVAPRIFLGYEITNLFIDVTILCIPISAVSQMNLPRPKKISVGSIFLLGSIVCFASILRLTAIWKLPTPALDFNLGRVYLYADVELGVAILAACLPTFGPLIHALWRPISSARKWYGLDQPRGATPSRSRNQNKRLHITNRENPWTTIGHDRVEYTSRSWAHGEDSGDSQYPLRSIPPRTILVNRQIDVQ